MEIQNSTNAAGKGGKVTASLYTVCFTGHRDIAPQHAVLLPQILEEKLLSLMEQGARCFRAGGAIGFDTVAALKLLELRRYHPSLQLHLYLPCRDQTRGWDDSSLRAYQYILSHADAVNYTTERYTSGCMLQRDRALVDGSDLCLAYCTKNRGGAFYTCAYAVRQKVPLMNLADVLPPLSCVRSRDM